VTAVPALSVVAPAYNEERVLPDFHRRLAAVLDELGGTAEVLYVNDGSSDRTVQVIRELRAQDPRVSLVNLSRNFGKEAALTAGLDHARGDWVVVIDTDLQDPPELIPLLLSHAHAGYDVVYARRTQRDGETRLKKATAYAFYRLMRSMSRVQIPEDTGDFRVLSRRAVQALVKLREQHRFMKGLFAWIGFPQIAVEYRRDPRFAGETKWNYLKLWNFAITGITSFTIAPLKIASLSGVGVAVLAVLYAAYFVARTLLLGNPVAGYPSLLVIVLTLGATQLITIGIIGEYLGRMFDEAKGRPLYVIDTYEPAWIRASEVSVERSGAGPVDGPQPEALAADELPQSIGRR
jgi:polyisoprenyl-phosphate glycosyltransferase